MSQLSQNFKVKEFVSDLFKRGYAPDKVASKIAKFFKAYDLSRNVNVENYQKQLENEKKMNSKIKNSKAIDLSDKSEAENLFLDAIDECKKEILKRKTLTNNISYR